jgi:hypothetical protein
MDRQKHQNWRNRGDPTKTAARARNNPRKTGGVREGGIPVAPLAHGDGTAPNATKTMEFLVERIVPAPSPKTSRQRRPRACAGVVVGRWREAGGRDGDGGEVKRFSSGPGPAPFSSPRAPMTGGGGRTVGQPYLVMFPYRWGLLKLRGVRTGFPPECLYWTDGPHHLWRHVCGVIDWRVSGALTTWGKLLWDRIRARPTSTVNVSYRAVRASATVRCQDQ